MHMYIGKVSLCSVKIVFLSFRINRHVYVHSMAMCLCTYCIDVCGGNVNIYICILLTYENFFVFIISNVKIVRCK